jgi:large subunit ribosomal protein L24
MKKKKSHSKVKKFFHVKRGDIVVVIAGSHKGKSGKILEMITAKDRARVEGVAMMKKHEKKSEKNPQGAITEREGSIHVSNLMLKEVYDASPRRKAALAAKAAAT